LVTGGSGFIGSHIVEKLISLNAKVTIVDNFTGSTIQNLKNVEGKYTLIKGDITNLSTVNAIKKMDIIFNEAVVSVFHSYKTPIRALEVNGGGIINILEFARKNDSKIIHASTGSVYGQPIELPIKESHPLNPSTPYGVSKLAAELYCNMYHSVYDLDVCCLRYFAVYGPRQRIKHAGVMPSFITRLLQDKPLIIYGNGKQTRDFTNVSDVVQANLLAGTCSEVKGEKFNIATGVKETSITELGELIGQLMNKKASFKYEPKREGDIRRTLADITKAKKILKYKPRVNLNDGLKELITHVSKWKNLDL